ncbi:glycosyltransferase family 2 protein [Urechidicola vernalis]|uniref:Glycosyltransferase family 2 protein n=1 Tax=Urechidicola vernalis TaxID=3075600 RepID=A0ABU2Y3P0_9FLAO|nr:glycosyltransferase family 2 protein [Urechidicola sp. P050]MDT0552269.1 glycosyltransferase family 2 protein [Urechidicola sp. P050]
MVSVCIPTYNGAQFILEALDSLNQQTYDHIEIVVSDDNSSDGTLQKIAEFKPQSKFPIHIFHHKPRGIAANWNYSIEKSKGKYIKLLFQDDVFEPSCVEEMVEVFEENAGVGLVTSKRSIISDLSNRFTEGWISNFHDLQVNLDLPDKDIVVRKGRSLLKSPNFKLKPINIIGEPSCYMFSKESFNTIGGFHKEMFQLVDYEFCLRIFKKYDVAFLKKSLVRFRLHQDQASFVNHRNKSNDKELFYRLLYRDYFWYLHVNFKWLLIMRFNLLIKLYRYFRYDILKIKKHKSS